MSRISEQVDFVVGVDTHKSTHTGAVVDVTGAVRATTTLPADAFGYRRLLAFAREQGAGRLWAIEGTGSFGRGLTTFMLEQQERVVEVDRPARPARRNGAKADDLDAVRAAREALSRPYLAQPRRRGDREAMHRSKPCFLLPAKSAYLRVPCLPRLQDETTQRQ
jgi:transposase